MNYQFIELSIEKEVGRVLLNRPEKLNALHNGMIEELHHCFTQLADNPEVRLVVLEGQGKSFCAGADLEWFTSAGQLSEQESKEQLKLLARMLQKLQQLPQITIALAKGNLFGGGIGLLSACDFVLMEESTVLAFSEVHLGLLPAIILPFVAGRISRQQAKRLILTGKYFSAEEAKRIELADWLVPEEQLNAVLSMFLSDLRKPLPGAMLDAKRLINRVYDGEIGVNDLEVTSAALLKRITSDDTRQRIINFMERIHHRK